MNLWLWAAINFRAYLESTKLTTISPPLVNRTSLISKANILGTLLNSALEEAFTALACSNAVMLACCDITANSTQLRWVLLHHLLSGYCCHSTRRCQVNVGICDIWIIVVDAWWWTRCWARCALKNWIFIVHSSKFRWLGTFTTRSWFWSLQR